MRRATVLLCLAACGSPAEPASAPTPPAAPTEDAPRDAVPSPEEAPREPVAWPDMSQEERLDHMRKVVMPAMKRVFQDHDAQRYATFGCPTCHGPGAKEGDFAMPSEALPRLDATDGFAAHRASDPTTTAWMMEAVVPAMAASLGIPRYDPATQTGFGCFGCHLEK